MTAVTGYRVPYQFGLIMLLVGLSTPRTMPRESKSPLRGFRYGVLVFALSDAWLWWLIIAAKDHVIGTEAELA